jgi:hypothetical protein
LARYGHVVSVRQAGRRQGTEERADARSVSAQIVDQVLAASARCDVLEQKR